MSFERPTLSELNERIRGDFEDRLDIQGSILRRAMARVMATVWAGAVHTLHGHLLFISRQLFPRTADRDFLKQQTRPYGISPTPATFAEGKVTATGSDSSTIPEGAVLVRDDGLTYETTSEATVSGGEVELDVVATEAGVSGNLDGGEELSFESPISGVDSEATVHEDGIGGGNDEESTEALLDRFELRLQEPPQGGADQDWEAWALSVAGVTRAWVFPHEDGLGTVTVRFVMDDREDIFPESSDVDAVQNALDDQRPITAEATAAAPTELEVGFTIDITPDTSTVRDAVESELEDMLRRDGEPGDGEGRGTIKLSRILTAIGVAEGVEDFDLQSPTEDVVPDEGELPVMGDITWA